MLKFMTAFKNLIFDLGEVIVDIDYSVTVAEFQKLALVDFSEVISYSAQHEVFDHFDKGVISASQFRDVLRQFLKPGTSDEQIDNAWNALIVAYPPAKFKLLKELKTRYKTFALSNTNEIHVAALDEAARTKLNAPDFGSFFHAAYYSNLTGHRKPEKEIYELVMQKENLEPEETFFVDDKKENIDAAKNLGWNASQLKDRNQLFELLAEWKII
jgi:epoxide hydrolase-like predicted phosphatase